MNKTKNKPEESVRQAVIHKLCHELGYPKAYISTEKTIASIAAMVTPSIYKNFPNRRVDVLVSVPTSIFSIPRDVIIDSMASIYPLILIECKAVKLHNNMLHQISGYNAFFRALCLCLVNLSESYILLYNASLKRYIVHKELPTFDCILEMNNIQSNRF